MKDTFWLGVGEQNLITQVTLKPKKDFNQPTPLDAKPIKTSSGEGQIRSQPINDVIKHLNPHFHL